MSEYQYYEFQAVDRPLTKDEIAEVRKLSTRATITSTRFQNVYNWSDFRGDPDRLMEKYYDAFVYVANWGTHRFMLRLPERLLDLSAVQPYALEDTLHARRKDASLILEFLSDDEEGGWVDDEESEGWLPSLLPLRADLARGDLRSLYVGWLQGAQNGIVDEDAREPAVPPGLRDLSASLQALIEFLRVDPDLVAAAAERSASRPPDSPARSELLRWIAGLPTDDKDRLLLHLVHDRDVHLGDELLQRFREATTTARAPSPEEETTGRTVVELLAAAKGHAVERRRREAEQAARERARQEREAAAARAKHLEGLVGSEDELWRRVETLVEVRKGPENAQAVEHLKDLRDLAARANQSTDFTARLRSLRERHVAKKGLLRRLDEAGLRTPD